jgi:hypothetical protein
MSTELLQLYSQNHWLADGEQTIWNFSFADGYISRSYVKAYYLDELNTQTEVPITNDMFIGPFQLEVDPPVPANHRFVILRDTPKDAPVVNFADGARVSEPNLDQIARQAVHIAAEVMDGSGQTVLLDQYGFKAMQKVPYTGVSTVLVADNGRAHYKTDGTGVIIPDTLPEDFLSTIVNDSESDMSLTFTDAVAVQQGSDNTDGAESYTLAPNNSASIYHPREGMWYISGKLTE